MLILIQHGMHAHGHIMGVHNIIIYKILLMMLIAIILKNIDLGNDGDSNDKCWIIVGLIAA